MSELCKLLTIRKLITTPYHSQANNLVERFNRILKGMLQFCAHDQPGKWYKRLLYRLFAYREVPQESTGFAQIELMYRRHVRGPLAIILLRENRWRRRWKPTVTTVISKLYYWDTVDLIRDGWSSVGKEAGQQKRQEEVHVLRPERKKQNISSW